MINVALVDDHLIVRDGIARLLSDFSDLKIIAKFDSGEAAFEFARKKQSNVMLMDLNMPGIGGIEATQKIAKRCPETKIILLTQYTKDPFPTQLLSSGALGYLSKESKIEEMVEAIRSVDAGKRYIASEIAKRLAVKNIADKSNNPFDRLSAREFQIMMKVVHAEKTKDIAKQLNLSTKTVNTLRYRLFSKLEVDNNSELIHLAIRYGLLDIRPMTEKTETQILQMEDELTEN